MDLLRIYKTQEAYIEAVKKDPYMLSDVPDRFKTLEMCECAKWVNSNLSALKNSPFYTETT